MAEVTDSVENEVKKKSPAGIIICLIALVALLGAGVAVFILGTGPARAFDRMYEDALMCINNRDYEGAVEKYQEMLDIAPANENALNSLNRAYMMWADYLEEDEPALSAEVMEDEVAYLTELNELLDSKKVERMIRDAEQNAKDYLSQDEPDPFGDPDPDPDNPDRPADDPTLVLESAYKYMSAGDYKSMLYVDGSEEADALVSLMKSRGQDVFIYGPDYSGEKDYTGEAMGLYIVPEGYYFYYGEYVDGVRKGYGTNYWKNGTDTYEMFQGYWDEDAPNGEGTITNRDEYNNTTTFVTGNFTDGHQDGPMSYDVLDSVGRINHGDYVATDGDAPEIKTGALDDDMYYYGSIPYVELTDGTIVYYSTSEYLGALGFRFR